ncbi:MAG: hypothetical protein ACI81V_001581 [Lentimonas sp.]|jgi:hypothetical protein
MIGRGASALPEDLLRLGQPPSRVRVASAVKRMIGRGASALPEDQK